MNNLMDIQSQIDKLQKQASDIKAREFGKTVQEIRAKMQAFGITANDLETYKHSAKTKKDPAIKKRAKAASTDTKAKTVAAKYRGPGGESWTGRGLTPRWLSALIEQGRQKQEFAITASYEPSA